MYIIVETKNENKEEMNILDDIKKYVILFDEIKGNENYLIYINIDIYLDIIS